MERGSEGSVGQSTSESVSVARKGSSPIERSPSLRSWMTSSDRSAGAGSYFVQQQSKGQARAVGEPAEAPRAGGEGDGMWRREGGSSLEGGEVRRPSAEVEGAEADLDPYLIPKAREAVLEKHLKTVSAISVDRSGSRVITGANDGQVNIYDFEGMKKDMKAFRKVSPSDGQHQVKSLSWSPTGDCFLAVTTSAQAKVFDRDGRDLGECVRGDMYLHDVRQTKGHTAGLTCGEWHPQDRDQCVTCSEDGTVRIWDITNLAQKAVIKPSLGKPGRVAATCCTYNGTGSLIAGGMMDGTIQLWSAAGKVGQAAKGAKVPAWKLKVQEKQRWTYNSRPGQLARGAHEADAEITGLCFSEDGHMLFSRSGDETLKVWDLRNFKKPLKVFEDLPCNYSTTGCALSPDQQLVLTGVSCNQSGEGGGLLFFDTSSLDLVRTIPFARSVTAVQWHPKLNQIFVGMGEKTYGETHILYDPALSTRGAMVCAGKTAQARDPLGLNAKAVIYAPNALPMFQENWSKKRAREKELKDPMKTKRPDPGKYLAGRGREGKVGVSETALLTQHLLKTKGKLKELGDPREALEKYTDGKSGIVLKAYQETQPKPIFQDYDSEDEEADEGEEQAGPRKVDPQTGMYISK
ncbi:WD40 repeat domain-containing protein [Chloropicon primus]|uniref:WD40 repeat domain-containing protein n=1 Tax=Chloropicon primus TaxID=1764295 RepID=A0A5B8MIV9_9CHLO|nr:WD40 repeat domain-containing protein [Chloropicon primus]UPQ99539.1 WD40 repeat domain-containing protein [Chloropicon primus]|eukprot:QDZ20329.1 WD40 repeat domain-containing protein [Chloropicon primus]